MSIRRAPPIAANSNWNGTPTPLAVNGSVTMPQTPNGSLVLGYLNQSQFNNMGRLTLTSGGSAPLDLPVPPLLRMFNILVGNWQANNLVLSNTSDNANTPLLVEAFGPGIPGVPLLQLPLAKPLQLAVTQAAQGTAQPRWMRLRLTGNQPATLETLAIVGGPPNADGNNAYVIALNADATTGPPGPNPARPGYYATTTGNSYDFLFSWSSSLVYVVNMSSQTASPATVLLQVL